MPDGVLDIEFNFYLPTQMIPNQTPMKQKPRTNFPPDRTPTDPQMDSPINPLKDPDPHCPKGLPLTDPNAKWILDGPQGTPKWTLHWISSRISDTILYYANS